MALTSTLYTGLSGLNVNQQKLNVIGNNIANVNTVAFKSSRTLFKPQFYVTDAAGSSPTAEFGGTNPSQRGLGASVASIQKNFNAGSIETTGVNTDVAIAGDGFFVVGNGTDQKYTRDGSFSLNENKELVTSAGDYVQGYNVDKDYNVLSGQLSKLTIPTGSLTIAQATSNVTFKGNLNANGVIASGASVLESAPLLDDAGNAPDLTTPLLNLRLASDATTPMFADGQELSLDAKRGGSTLPPATFTIDAGTTVEELTNFLRTGMGIDTSADVTANAPAGFTPGAAFAATTAADDPAGSLRLQVTGNVGASNKLDLNSLNRTPPLAGSAPVLFSEAINSAPVGESQHTSMQVFDSLGTPLNVDLTLALESKTPGGGTTWRYFASSAADSDTGKITGASTDQGSVLGSGTISFDENGLYKASTNTAIAIDRTDSGAATPSSVKLDFSALKSLDAASAVTLDGSDGYAAGELKTFSIGQTGTIDGFFSNGQKRTLGQLAMASFDNPQGLVDQGGNNYRVGASSGQPIVSDPGQFGTGLLQAGSLEQSNVDLSKEFIDMIVTSTGFSAASRVITTSDQLLNELLQTTR